MRKNYPLPFLRSNIYIYIYIYWIVRMKEMIFPHISSGLLYEKTRCQAKQMLIIEKKESENKEKGMMTSIYIYIYIYLDRYVHFQRDDQYIYIYIYISAHFLTLFRTCSFFHYFTTSLYIIVFCPMKISVLTNHVFLYDKGGNLLLTCSLHTQNSHTHSNISSHVHW